MSETRGPLRQFVANNPDEPLYMISDHEKGAYISYKVNNHGSTVYARIRHYRRARDAKRALLKIGYEKAGVSWRRPTEEAPTEANSENAESKGSAETQELVNQALYPTE